MNPQPSTLHRAAKLWLPIALFSILWLDLIRQLGYTWETNEQYAYGWFVPFLAVALFFRRWMDRPLPLRLGRGEPDATLAHPMGEGLGVRDSGEVSPSSATILHPPSANRPRITHHVLLVVVLLAALLLLPLRVIHEINQDWPLITWPLTAIVVALSLYAVFLAGGWRWVKYFAFPVCFILVAVKWPYRIEHGLTQNLMQVVASLTVEIIGWFGIPALQRGNLIEIGTGVLGVDEACSGIRSLQSTLMAALFLGELYRLKWPLRLGLLIGGVIVSFALNVVRTLFLTWQANKEGLSAIDKWHDPAGFTITIACFFVLWGVAVLIKRVTESRKQPGELTEGLHAPRPSEVSGPVEYQSDSTGRGNLHGPRKAESGNVLATSAPSTPLRLDRGEPDATLAHRMGEGQGVRAASEVTTRSSGLPASVPCAPHSAPQTPEPTPQAQETNDPQPPKFQISTFSISAFSRWRRYATAIGLWSLLCIGATEGWYRSHEVSRTDTAQWWVNYPTNLPSFQSVTVSKASAKLLKHDVESGGAWDEPDGTKWAVYCFRWREGDPTARMSAQGHRPEYCLVGSGHNLVAMSEPQSLPADGINLPFRFYTFDSVGRPLHVFFCLWEDGTETQVGFGKTKQGDRLRTVWAGRRGMGQQTLEIICQGYPDMAGAERAVRERLPELIRIENHPSARLASGRSP